MIVRLRWMVCVLAAATLPLSALASEGAIEINQARALAGGVTTGDAQGLPVTISSPGRYVLTGSLTLPGTSTNGIEIQSDDVTLDLNGFRIAGGTTCTGFGTTLSCAPQGLAVGIFSSQHEGITIRNGSITGAAGNAIMLLKVESCRIEGLTIAANGKNGLFLTGGCDIDGIIVDRNAEYGILEEEDNSGSPDVIARESVMSRNFRNGVISSPLGISNRFSLLRSVVHGNGGNGIDLLNQGTVHDCVIYGNAAFGIRLVSEGHVRGNAVRSNRNGFSFGAQVGYDFNVFSDHMNASSGGVKMGGQTNLCIANGPGSTNLCP